ncbi:MAG: LysM peptidoglycan-binding domain-containing protein [Anaerolineales bacterium]
MTVNTSDNYLKDPLFQRAMNSLQLGNWQDGLSELDQLVQNYPASRELKSLKEEMRLRARVDDDEREDIAAEKRQRLRKNLLRLVFLALLFVAILWGVLTYSTWIQNQLLAASNRLDSQVRTIEMAAKFRNGQNLMVAGRVDEALVLFEEIAAVDKQYPGLEQAMQHVNQQLDLEAKYFQAMQFLDRNDLPAALAVFESITSIDPYYKDVAIRTDEINNQFFLADLYNQADRAYQQKQWEQAASGYETIRAINQQYKQEQIEGRLLDSYLQAADSLLAAQSDSFEALESAEGYYRKALALRPQDEQVLQERERTRAIFREGLSEKYVQAALAALGGETDSIKALEVAEEYFRKAFALTPDNPDVQAQYDLAQRYLQAQDDFNQGNYDAVIESLGVLYQDDPNYASGTARQTLYEAHIARGNYLMASGEYLLALNDFQRASAIAENNPESLLSIYSAKIKVGEAFGALTNYEDAVFVYEDALELVDLSLITDKEFEPTREKLAEADHLAEIRYYRQAYKLYKDAAPKVLTSFSALTHIVENEDYLTSLANRYHTTVEAIVKVNNLISPKQIQAGQELIIPGTLP